MINRKMETARKTYDVLLNSALDEFGLYSLYLANGEYDPRADMHVIRAEIRPPKKLWGWVVPFTDKTVPVAIIESEPKQVRTEQVNQGSVHSMSLLDYDGLQIRITDHNFTDKIRAVAQKLEKELGEPVTLLQDKS